MPVIRTMTCPVCGRRATVTVSQDAGVHEIPGSGAWGVVEYRCPRLDFVDDKVVLRALGLAQD